MRIALLRTILKEEVYVTPPVELYPECGLVWEQWEAMQGLKTTSKAWELQFAEARSVLVAGRLRGEPNVYYCLGKNLCAMSCVDDMLAIGPQDASDSFYGTISQLYFVVKHLGELGSRTWREGHAVPRMSSTVI